MLFSFAVVFGAGGCGPGFPIMTSEQAALVNNVDSLLKENDALKKRVAGLEGFGAGDLAKTKKELEEAKAALADARDSIEQVRREVSFMKGSFEESGHAKALTREEIKGLSASMKAVNARLSAIENSMQSAGARLEADEKKTAVLGEAAVAADKRLTDLEGKAAKGVAPPAGDAPRAGDAAPDKKEEDPRALYQKGADAMSRKDYQAALDSFGRFLTAFPGHKLSGSAQYWLGEAYYRKKDFEKAIVEFDKAVKNYPRSDKAPAAVLKQGLSFERLGAKRDALALYRLLTEKYPKSPEAAAAKKRLQAMKRK